MSDRKASLDVEISGNGVEAGGRSVTRSIDEIKRSAGGLDRQTKQSSLLLGGLGKAMALVGVSFSIAKILQVSREFETLRSRLETVMGSAVRGAAAFSALQKMAASTPFQVQELVDAYVRLQAQGIAPTESLMRSLGNTASAMGKGLVQASEALLDAQMGEFERLKEFGIKARDEGSKVAFTFKGVTTEVEKNSGAIVGYLEKIGNTDFVGAMDRQSKTLNGALSNLEDSTAALMDKVGSSGLARELGILAGQMGKTAAAGDGMAQRIGQGLGVLIGSVSLLATGFNVAAQSIGIVLGRIGQGLAIFGEKANRLILATLENINKVATFFGKGIDASAFDDVKASIASMEEWSGILGDFATTSGEQAAEALLSLGKGWEELQKRTMAATEASNGATASLDDLAAGAAGAGSGVKLTAAEVKKFDDELQRVRDEANPAAASVREVANKVDILHKAFLLGKISRAEFISDTDALTASASAAADALFDEASGLFAVKHDRKVPLLPNPNAMDKGTIEIEQNASEYQKEMDAANKAVVDNLANGYSGVISGFAAEFAKTGKFSADDFGDALLNVFIDSVAQWLQMQLAAQFKAALSRRADDAASNAADAAGKQGNNSNNNSNSGAGAVGMVMVALAVWMMAKKKSVEEHRYETGGIYRSDPVTGAASAVTLEASNASKAIADSMRTLMETFQTSTGHYIQGMNEVTIKARNDGKMFEVLMAGVALGTFKTMGEAIVAGFAAAMKDTDLSSLDPAMKELFADFSSGTGTNIKTPEAFQEAVDLVQKLSDMGSGLTEADHAITALLPNFQSLIQHLMSLGISASNATRLAGNALIDGLRNERDAITGHEQTADELMAIQQQRSVLFNAEVALVRAELELKKQELLARLGIYNQMGEPGPGGTGGGVGGEGGGGLQHTIERSTATMGSVVGDSLKAQIEMYGVWSKATVGMTAATLNSQVQMTYAASVAVNASVQAILDSIAAIDAILANLPDPISPGEIRIPGRGGKGRIKPINTGPTPAEQLALDIATFNESLDNLERSLSGGLLGRLAELSHWYAEQITEATRLGLSLDRVNDLYRQQMAILAKEVLGGLGIASVNTQQQMEELRIALEFLRAQGAITEDQIRELGDQMFVSLADGLLQFVENEEVRSRLEDLRFRMQMYQYELQFVALRALNLLTDQQVSDLEGIFASIWDAYNAGTLGFQNPNQGQNQGGDNGANDIAAQIEAERQRREQALISALDRLRAFGESYRQWRENLATSELSGLTAQQRSDEAANQFNSMMAQAQAGNLDAIGAMPGLANQYLELLGQTIDPSSAQYQQIRAQIMAQMSGIEGGIAGLLSGANSPAEQTVQELRTIADILNEIRVLWGGNPSWNPGSGMGTILPGPGPRPGTEIGHSRNGEAIQVYDAAGRAAIERMEARLSARLEAGLARVARATETQTAKEEAARFRKSAKAGKSYGGYDRDEVAS